MSWFSRKLTKSDWCYPVDYETYFRKKTIKKQMTEWYNEELEKARDNEWKQIWQDYEKNRKKNEKKV